MAITIQMDTTIDVVSKYNELVQEALGDESLYSRMKENLVDLLADGNLKAIDKAKTIADAVSHMAVGLSGQVMDTAIKWAAQEKEMVLKKAELEYRLAVLDKESAKVEQDVENAKEAKKLAQAKRLREYGVATLDSNGNVIGLSDSGFVYQQQKLVEKQIEQGTAAISKIDDDKLTAAKQRLSIEKQTELYQRQKEGFDDNKYQKLFETQINAWGVMFSSGMLAEKPAIIASDKVSQLYNSLTANL
jgi:hypothetical protein